LCPLIALILNKHKGSFIDKRENLNIIIDKLTLVEKQVHFELAHNQPPSKLQTRISNEQSHIWKGINRHSKKPDKQNNVCDVKINHRMA